MIGQIPVVTIIFLIVFSSWYILGKGLVKKMWPGKIPQYLYPIFPVLGAAVYTYSLLFIGLWGLLNIWTISALVLTIWIFFWRNLSPPQVRIKLDRFEQFLLLAVIVFASYYFIASFAPAYRYDELAYHLPEVESISQSGLIRFPLRGDIFFGHLPAFMEVLYSSGVILAGLPLAHLFHYCWVLVLIAFIVLFLQKEKNTLAGLIFSLGLFFTTELISYSTTLYVDIAASIFEFIGIVLLFEWFKSRNSLHLFTSGLLFAVSVSIKFTALYSLPIYLFLIGACGLKKHFRQILTFAAILSLFGGFWYLKNWFLTGSPVFPYELTMKGIQLKAEFTQLDELVKNFSLSRSLYNFLQIPYLLFLNATTKIWGVIMFVFSLSSLLYLFFRRQVSDKQLVAVVILKFAFWFFLISHQLRLNYTGILLIVYFGSLVLSKLRRFLLPLALISTGIFVIRLPDRSIRNIAVNLMPFSTEEIKLAAGLIDEKEFLTRKTGEIYLITDYLNSNASSSAVVNYWNKTAAYYLKNGNAYISDVPAAKSEYEDFIRSNNVSFLAVDIHFRASYINSKDWDNWWQPRSDFESYLIDKSSLVFESPNGWARLYKLNH
jgi:hypothetical protein